MGMRPCRGLRLVLRGPFAAELVKLAARRLHRKLQEQPRWTASLMNRE